METLKKGRGSGEGLKVEIFRFEKISPPTIKHTLNSFLEKDICVFAINVFGDENFSEYSIWYRD